MASSGPVAVAVALGSNVGDRQRTLRDAVTALSGILSGIRLSSFHETAYVGDEEQPAVLNGALIARTGQPITASSTELYDDAIFTPCFFWRRSWSR